MIDEQQWIRNSIRNCANCKMWKFGIVSEPELANNFNNNIVTKTKDYSDCLAILINYI